MGIRLCFIWLLLLPLAGFSVTDTLPRKTSKIVVKGTVKEARSGMPVPGTLIIRKGVGGSFLNLDGTFRVSANRSDTILISATGYNIHRLCFKDSVGSSFTVKLKLTPLKSELATATVMPKRKLSEIHEDLEGMRLKLPNRPTGADALQSPITALYAAFSKTERSKRLVAEMEYRDHKEMVLKELFRVYVDADIINLSPDEFERFMYYSNPSDDFIRRATEYELITFFQQRFKEYVAFEK